ncbi:hypothetical protein [Shimia thalassica]|uniref:hypothetical protein n=1 Tax=Shimia thalassica TaxID=1715693 RepID=UPI00071D8D20|nr:hypothetical protein [Shimia thalassica]
MSVGLYVGARGQAWKARRPATGRKRWHKTTLGSIEALTYKEAVRAAQDWADGIETQQEVEGTGGPVIVAMACTAWLARKEAEAGGITAQKTRDGWTSYAKRVSDWFGSDTPLHDVTVAKCEAWRDRGNRSASAGDRDLATAKAILTSGADTYEFDGKRAWEGAKKKGEKIIAIERADQGDEGLGGKALSLVQVRRLIDGAEPEFANFLRVMFLTLQRPQALRMADVRDFDPTRAKLRLRRGKNAAKRGVIEIDLFAGAVDLLKDLTAGRPGNRPLLIGPDDQRWPEGFQFGRIKAASATANLDDVTLYTIRHSAISWAATDGGVDALTIAKMADTSVEIILKHYFHRTEKLGTGPTL